MAWDTAATAAQRREEQARQAWWAEHCPPVRSGGGRRDCLTSWPGVPPPCLPGAHGSLHRCARPAGHPPACTCRCGDRLTPGQLLLW